MCELRTDADVCPTDRVPTVRADFERDRVADEAIGRVIAGRFRVERPLGRGGSGRVYLATQLSIGREVALKLLHPDHARDRVQVRRFYREARAATRLGSEHVVRIIDFGVDDETRTPFIAMEYLEGETLRERIARGPVAPKEAARIGAAIARALGEAAAAGIVHRDLKPANVMCVAGRDGPTVKVMDFGVAKDLAGGDTDTLTLQGVALGTPAYMAPEQVSGGDVGPRTDLYALGCVLFEMVTGAPLFASDARAELYVDHLLKPAPPLPAKVGDAQVPAALLTLVGRLLAKAPEERPGSAEEVAERLAAIAEERPADLAPLRAAKRKRSRLWALGVSAAATLGAIAVAASAVSADQERAPSAGAAWEQVAKASYEHLIVRGAAATVRLRVGEERGIAIAGDPMRVTQEIEDGRLTLAIAAPTTSDEALVIDVTAPTWKTIKVSGLATVEGQAPLGGEELSLALSGSARLRLEVRGPSVVTSLRGSSEATLSGEVTHHEIRAGGASRLDARALVGEEVSIAASGSSDVFVHARARLDARNDGTGEIVYYGAPPELSATGPEIRAGSE